MSNDVIIRSATPNDLRVIIDLIKEHAAYEQADICLNGREALLSKHLSNSSGCLKIFVAECNHKVMGYASFMKQFSTWDAAYYLYLDCLYLVTEARGMGIGKRMMDRIKEYALQQDCKLIQWQTPDFNHNAIQFYNKIGAKAKNKVRFFWKIAEERKC